MSHSPDGSDAESTPRTWVPFVIALSIAAIVVVGAVVASSLRSGMSAPKAAAVEACEAAYQETVDPEEPVRIVAGDVYGSAEWRDLHSYLVEQETIGAGETTDEDAAALDTVAQDLAAADSDRIAVVWWLSSDEHLACTAEVEGETVVPGTVVLRSLDSLDPVATLG